MNRLYTVLLLSLLTPLCVSAQQKVKDVVSDEYNRNGLAILLTKYNDSYDNQVAQYFNLINQGGKFDANDIGYTTIPVKYSRNNNNATTRSNAINTAMTSTDYGKATVNYLYNRQPSGEMDIDRVLERGHYNATDANISTYESLKLGLDALGDTGFQLIANNYVLVVDYYHVDRITDKKTISWKVAAEGRLYRINYDDDIAGSIFDCWIYDDDTEEQKALKRRKYDALKIGMEPIATVSTSQTFDEADGGLKKAVTVAYEKLIYELEKGNDDWLVKASIYQTKPIKAKIGTKEGLKNGARFDVYRYEEDRSGNLTSSKRGTVRATTIAYNTRVADKETPASEFYQIAGMKLDEGMVLKQRNDLGMGISAGYRMGGMSGGNVIVDYLIKINTKGVSHYTMIDMSLNFYSPSKSGLSGYGIPSSITAFDAAVGYGIGVRASRYFEFVPHAMIGVASLTNNDEYVSDNDETDKNIGYSLTAGLKLHINVYYPAQLFAGLNYTLNLGGGAGYMQNNSYLKEMNKQRQGVGINFGIRYIF